LPSIAAGSVCAVWGRARRAGVAVGVVLLTAMLTLGIAGYFLFTAPHGDPLSHADAIVVLGGDKDGRIDYGLDLARRGHAATVVISDAYRQGDQMIKRACAAGTATITVICFRPSPFTTRGEAMFVQRMAAERGWKHVIVVSWNYHLVRARFIFHQCFDGEVTMRPAPVGVVENPLDWAYVYAYQYVGLAKAVILGCDRG
jgi:uncharacterized SAM-binding protein YcdF (DUF218 family)